MALIADGLHMATHAGVMFVSAAAYRFARAKLADPGFSFGTGKVGDLAAFASACALAATAVFIAIESVGRLIAPVPIAFDEAIVIAIIGLIVNLLSVWLLHDHNHGHDHDHDHHDHHDHEDGHHAAHVHRDHNIRAAYVHIIADAGVGLAAIVALVLGRQFGWLWLDPAIGLVGAYVILRWAWVLAKAAGSVLLDRVSDPRLAAQVRALAEAQGGRVVDLHLWRVGPGHNALIVAIEGGAHDAGHYRARLSGLATLSHVTVEIVDVGDSV
jgi:cation diffusion facilitator family transporter